MCKRKGGPPSISTQKTGGSTYLSLGYSYFAAGQIQQITNNLNSNKSEKYSCDDVRRLLTAQLGPDAAMVRKYQYDYDRYGNRWGQNVVAGSGYNGQLAFDTASNRVNWAGFSFDASGNLATNSTGTTFTFNQESFLTSAGAVSYKIDAQGRRVRKTNGATVTDYFYSGSELLAEKIAGQWTDYIFIGDQRIAQQTGNSATTATYLHVDHLGSTRVCTDVNGNSNGTCDYEPFGETQVGSNCSVPTNFRYAGMQWDSESSLFHTWFRQYDATQGRWMGVDPLPGSEGVSQSMDRYAYVLNDPVNEIDIYGLVAGDFLVMQGGWDFIGGQLFQCQLDGISMSCGDFADFGYLKKLWQEAAFGEWIGNYNEHGGYYIYDLALANKLLGLQLAAQPSPSPCKGLKASDIIYTAAQRTHAEEDHMNYLANGQRIAPKMGAGQYVFTPQGTKDENWALVVLINAVTVTMGKPVFQPDTGNYAITFGLPPQVSDLAGNTPLPIRRWVGRAWNQNWRPFHPRYYTTNVNTVLLGPDCRTYVTSFPGVPNR